MVAAWILLALLVVLAISNAWAGDVEDTARENAERERNGDEPVPDDWWIRPVGLTLAAALGVGELWVWTLV